MSAATKPVADSAQQLQQMQELFRSADAMAQPALGQISAIASLTLRALESPVSQKEATAPLDAIAEVLELIEWRANDAANFISCQAEQAGCHYRSPAWLRRLNAQHGINRRAGNDGSAA